MADPITEKTETYETSNSALPYVGSLEVATPRGLVHAVEVPGTTVLLIESTAHTSIAILNYDPDGGAGLFNQSDAGGARAIAASLLRLADRVDGGATRN